MGRLCGNRSIGRRVARLASSWWKSGEGTYDRGDCGAAHCFVHLVVGSPWLLVLLVFDMESGSLLNERGERLLYVFATERKRASGRGTMIGRAAIVTFDKCSIHIALWVHRVDSLAGLLEH